MNAVNFTKSLLFSAVLALLGFFSVKTLGDSVSSDILFAVGILIGGVLIPLFLPSQGGEEAQESSASVGEVKTLYVGNLPYRANEAAVRTLFEDHGKVFSVRLMKDRQTGRRKGYGFVEMELAGANKAIKALNDNEFQQRTLKVREAKERKEEE
ncbi:RNA recognition motif domain-containing protein [Corallincola platygyrae]|uniref:RNA recognition motif domain-containing protein n=1 Tax=Corallincola platygyrae TaxID=1193278 RepID=A0ABW4XR06_9GAMM